MINGARKYNAKAQVIAATLITASFLGQKFSGASALDINDDFTRFFYFHDLKSHSLFSL